MVNRPGNFGNSLLPLNKKNNLRSAKNTALLKITYEYIKNDQLILMDKDSSTLDRNWDYLTAEVKIANFYQNFDEARVLINNNVTFHSEMNDAFKILKAETVTDNSQEKTYLTIEFNGMAYGWYDPKGEYQEVYEVIDGVFSGMIE